MARYTGPVCKLCRREGIKLYLKGSRCYDDNKCALKQRPYPPGQHGHRRVKLTDYGIRLREKQKLKRHYGLLEKQFKNLFYKAERMKGVTGVNFLILLERRLDNVVYRASFASSRRQARQLVNHAHFLVNGRKVNIPSFLVSVGDVITVREKSKNIQPIQEAISSGREVPSWLEVDYDKLVCKVISMPTREHITLPVNEQYIVELYSK